MPKPMSDKIPPALKDRMSLLGFEHLSDLSDRANLPRSTVRCMFQKNKLEGVRIFLALAKTLQIPPDELADLIAN